MEHPPLPEKAGLYLGCVGLAIGVLCNAMVVGSTLLALGSLPRGSEVWPAALVAFHLLIAVAALIAGAGAAVMGFAVSLKSRQWLGVCVALVAAAVCSAPWPLADYYLHHQVAVRGLKVKP